MSVFWVALGFAASLSYAEPIHFDGVDGPPAWAGRVNQSIRDSLAARGADLWPADSLTWLKDRNEWPGTERTPERVAALAKRTRRTTIAWAKVEAPVGTFDRPWWSVFWTRRIWTAQADIFVANAEGKARVTHLALERKTQLRFTGTNGPDLWPITEPEKAVAEFAILKDLSGQAAKLVSETGTSAKP